MAQTLLRVTPKMRWAQRFGGNLSLELSLLIYSLPQPFSPTPSSEALRRVKGLKNAKNLMYVKRVLNSKLRFTWEHDIKIFLAFRKLGAGML